MTAGFENFGSLAASATPNNPLSGWWKAAMIGIPILLALGAMAYTGTLGPFLLQMAQLIGNLFGCIGTNLLRCCNCVTRGLTPKPQPNYAKEQL